MNNRLVKFAENSSQFSDFQYGSREKRSTTDCIFILHNMIKCTLDKKKKLYCTFVDFKAAFDLVTRDKLQCFGVSNKIVDIIKSMYSSVKLCIRQFSSLSDFFNSNVGVKQGEPLSPFLFLLYINDLADELRCGIDGNLDELSIFLLFFADDLVIIAKSPEELQSLIDKLFVYCQEWNLSVNIKKTKVVIFDKKKSNNEIVFHYVDNELDIVDSHVYLGINVKNNGTFLPAMESLCNQAIRAVFGIKSMYKAKKINH